LWETLRNYTERLFANGDFGVALIVAQTACEVVVERAMQKAFDAKKIPELDGPIRRFKPYSLAQDRNRKLYTALTGDDIGQAPFWSSYQKFVELRNKSAHNGESPDKDTTRTALDAAKDFVEHVVKHNAMG
jgi:hypothetical protein